MLITSRWNPRSPFHEDLVFEIDDIRTVADTYYFELDHPPDSEGGWSAVIETLRALLRQWLARLDSQDEGSTLVLPFDYSDEYTGVLLATREDEDLLLVWGWTRVEGWASYPTNLDDFDARVRQRPPQRQGPVVRVSRRKFRSLVEESLAAL